MLWPAENDLFLTWPPCALDLRKHKTVDVFEMKGLGVGLRSSAGERRSKDSKTIEVARLKQEGILWRHNSFGDIVMGPVFGSQECLHSSEQFRVNCLYLFN